MDVLSPPLLFQQFLADFADGDWGDMKIGGDFLQGKSHHDAGTALQEFFVAGGGIGAVEVEETGVGLYEQVFCILLPEPHGVNVFFVAKLGNEAEM